MNRSLAMVFLLVGCGASADPKDAGESDAIAADDSSSVDATAGADVLEASSPKDAVSEPKPAAISCGDFQGVIDGGTPIACTGSNWQWASTTLQPQGPCSAMTCPTNAGWNCIYQGQHGYVICP